MLPLYSKSIEDEGKSQVTKKKTTSHKYLQKLESFFRNKIIRRLLIIITIFTTLSWFYQPKAQWAVDSFEAVKSISKNHKGFYNPFVASSSDSIVDMQMATSFDAVYEGGSIEPTVVNNTGKITLIAFWDRDRVPAYLRHFFYSAQLNADSVDLVFINRRLKDEDQCIDFENVGFDVQWGGNVHIKCMDEEEWRSRVVNFMCSESDGWNCNDEERSGVTLFFRNHHDWRNAEWRPLHGYIFRDLLPDNSLWAFIDTDLTLGRLDAFPIEVASSLSWVTFQQNSIEKTYFAGQLTIFNFNDKHLSSTWKKIPNLETADIFLKSDFKPSFEEKLWSWAYITPENGLPGSELSYAIFPYLRGDDEKSDRDYLISGRDVLLLDFPLSRIQAEHLLLHSRAAIADNNLAHSEASLDRQLRNSKTWFSGFQKGFKSDLNTIVTEVELEHNCPKSSWINPQWRNCVLQHPLTQVDGPWQTSVVHFKDQEPGKVYERLDFDYSPRSYRRKLYKHHLYSKKYSWMQFPPFDIDSDHIMLMSSKKVEVFKIGDDRDMTIYTQENLEDLG